MNRITATELEEFRLKTLDRTRAAEIECGNFLKFALDLLTAGTPVQLFEYAREERNYFGSTDFVVPALMRLDSGTDDRIVYIWELKAPQSYILERDDNNNRFRPTKELIKAETQLLHYYTQAHGDTGFRERYELVHQANIKIGGIIIGYWPDRYAKGAETDAQIKQATHSLSLRKRLFYDACGLRILTWDRVVEHLSAAEGPVAES